MQIRRNHTLGIDEAKRRVDKIAETVGERFSLGSKWEGENLRFFGTGINGAIAVAEDFIQVNVELGFALMMLEGSIRDGIEAAMDKHLD